MPINPGTLLFQELVAKYAPAILAGNISERELAADPDIGSRRQARKVRDWVEENLEGEVEYSPEKLANPELSDDEYNRLVDRVASEALEAFLVDQGCAKENFVEPQGAPRLQEVTGYKVSNAKEVDVDALVEKATALFDRAQKKASIKNNQRVVIDRGPACLVFGGDEHFGGKTNVRRMLSEAQLVNETPGMFHVRMGDLVNQFILGRMRSIRDNAEITIPEEWILGKMLVKLIAPKLIAFVGGNHDDWARKASGMDRLVDILPDGVIYDPYEIQFDVHVGNAVKTVKLRHRWKGSSVFNPTHGMEVAAQRDLADWDIAVGAHTHQAALVREFFAQGKRRLAVLTNTYKQYDDFAREIGFPRSDISSTVAAIIIEEDGSMFGAPTLEWAARYMNMRHGA